MKNKNKEKSIAIGLVYTVVFFGVLAFVLIIFAFLPLALKWNDVTSTKIFWALACFLLAIACILMVAFSYQTAMLSKRGIIIRSILGEVAMVQWNEIVKIGILDLPSMQSRDRTYYLKWIVIYTSHEQRAKYGGGNRKNRPPWLMKYNKNNIATLRRCLKRYSTKNVLLGLDSQLEELAEAERLKKLR